MRLAAIASTLAIVVCAAIFGAIFLQKASLTGAAPSPAQAAPDEQQQAAPVAVTTLETPAAATNAAGGGAAPTVVAQAAPAQAPPPAPAPIQANCSNPNAIGISRIVEIDTTGGPGFGFEHFKTHDFLREGEVVLT